MHRFMSGDKLIRNERNVKFCLIQLQGSLGTSNYLIDQTFFFFFSHKRKPLCDTGFDIEGKMELDKLCHRNWLSPKTLARKSEHTQKT